MAGSPASASPMWTLPDRTNGSQRRSQGAAEIVELLNAQGALADARTEQTRSLAAWRCARLRLLASVGMLDKADARD